MPLQSTKPAADPLPSYMQTYSTTPSTGTPENPATVTATPDSELFECALVRVLQIVNRTGTQAPYKTVKVKQELGYWFRTFRFNLFPSHPLYTTIKPDMSLDIKVSNNSHYFSLFLSSPFRLTN